MPRSRPIRPSSPIAVTMGDPKGVGPEVLAKAIARLSGRDLLVFGDERVLRRTATRLGLSLPALEICHLDAAWSGGGVGFVSTADGWIGAGRARARVTAPMRKLKGGRNLGPAPGHTEWLSYLNGVRPFATLLMVTPRLKVSLVTNHLPLAKVPPAVTRPAVLLAIRRTAGALREWFGVKRPRIGVLGLNPHAGENGKLGREEEQVIAPAIAQAHRGGIAASGPLPADSALFQAVRERRWDAVVAMYHDQGLIPAKIDGFGDAVNVSLGLPYVRTSVDHGTAYDIAGKGIADPSSLIAAIRLARRLTMA